MSLVVTAVWFCLRGRYYEWVLDGGRAIDVAIMCDTSGFRQGVYTGDERGFSVVVDSTIHCMQTAAL